MKRIVILVFSLLALASIQAQGRLNLSNIVRPTTGPNIVIGNSSLSPFTTTTGTASSTQSTTYNGTNLTANIIITMPSGFEGSINGGSSYNTSLTATQSGGNASGTLLVRVAASTSAGSYNNISITFASTGATTRSCAVSATVNPTSPFISGSVNSLPSLSTLTGTASILDSFTVSGGNLTANALVTFPTGFEGTLNKTAYTSTVTLNQSGGTLTGQPVWVYTRIAASTGVGSYTDPVIITSTGATPDSIAITGTVSSSNDKDSIRVQFDSTSVAQSGWTIMRGAPNLNVITATGGNSGTITVSSISTSSNNWKPVTTVCAFPNNGTPNGTVWNYAPNVMRECWFSYNDAYNASYPKIKISGLKTGGVTYTLKITSSISTSIAGFACDVDYRILGNSLYGPTVLAAQSGGVENTANSVTFTNIVPDGTGSFNIYFNQAPGNNLASISAFILKEN